MKKNINVKNAELLSQRWQASRHTAVRCMNLIVIPKSTSRGYKKATEDIIKYANLKIGEIVSNLKEKYPEPIFADCITANTDPDYYY
jgi:hypothetical protein